MILGDRFEEWIPTVGVGREQRETFWVLEDWGAEVPKTMKKDREGQKMAMKKARGDLYLAWCWKVRISGPSAAPIMSSHSQNYLGSPKTHPRNQNGRSFHLQRHDQ